MRKMIQIKEARENNQKNSNLEIPREALTVITGVSGSGMSSLAYDMKYSESQRRLLDSLSAYSRRYIPQPHEADVDSVDGLSMVVAIMRSEQLTSSAQLWVPAPISSTTCACCFA
jgi:excinuclease ABC subunit A